jgi:hypothetical protein
MNSTESMLIIISPIKPVFLLLKTIFPPDRFFKFMMQFSASAKNYKKMLHSLGLVYKSMRGVMPNSIDRDQWLNVTSESRDRI